MHLMGEEIETTKDLEHNSHYSEMGIFHSLPPTPEKQSDSAATSSSLGCSQLPGSLPSQLHRCLWLRRPELETPISQ